MPTRLQRQTQTSQRRRSILDASLRCFLERGVEAATIEQIRDASGTSSGSIYHHFGSKQAIAIALYVEGLQELDELYRQAIAGQTSLEAGLSSIIHSYFRWIDRNRDWALYLLRVATADLSAGDVEAVDEVNRRSREMIIEWLRPFAQRGELADIPEGLYSSLIFGPTTHFARHWLVGRMSVDLPSAAKHFAVAAHGAGRRRRAAAAAHAGQVSVIAMTQSFRTPLVSRRTLLKAAVAGAALAPSAGRLWGGEGAGPGDSKRAISELYRSLDADQRAQVCFDWDFRVDIKYGRKPLWRPDPSGVLLRTHLSNAWHITPPLIGGDFYTDEQRQLIVEVLRTTMAPDWIARLQTQASQDSGMPWGDDQALAIFGTPEGEAIQCVITGFHLTIRATSEPKPAAAFGGPISHGHQPSGFYERFNHPGNFFWQQSLLANEVYRLLDSRQQQLALVTEPMPWFKRNGEVSRTLITADSPWEAPRHEQDIRFRRAGDAPLGIPVTRLGREQRGALEAVLAGLVEPYQQTYQDQVRDCIAQRGGLDACSLAFYRQRDMGQDGVWDNWRLEGPALTWFFRGSPHVHIWIHVASDPQAPFSSYFG